MWRNGVCMLVMVVVAVVVMTSDPVEGWVRFRFRGRRFFRKVNDAAMVYKVATMVGKRDTDSAGSPTAEEQQQIAEDLEARCSRLPADPAVEGLTRSTVLDAFIQHDSDEPNDDSLKGDELKKFVDLIELYEDCAEMEDKRK